MGVTVRVVTYNVKSAEETLDLIAEATKLSPIGGIFHLAMVNHYK